MAVKNVEGLKSLRLNAIPVGSRVTLVDFNSKDAFATATLSAWRNGKGETIAQPVNTTMKNLPADTTILFAVDDRNEAGEITGTHELSLTRDKDGYGCFFRNTQPDPEKPAILRRVTAYAASDVLEARDVQKKKLADEKAAAKIAKELAEHEAAKTNGTDAKPAKRGRPAKEKVEQAEANTVTETTETETASVEQAEQVEETTAE